MKSFKYTTLNTRPYEAHAIIYSIINKGTTLLDIGSATGYFAKVLKQKKCIVWGIELDSQAANKSQKYLKHVFTGNIDNLETFRLPHGFFDYILLMDIIEHITNTEGILPRLKQYLKTEGKIIISTPNIAHISIRLNLLFGNFNYTKIGILDESHVHFYTKKTLNNLLKKSNYSIEKTLYSTDFGQIPLFGRYLRYIPKKIQYVITKIFNTLFAVQFIVIASYG